MNCCFCFCTAGINDDHPTSGNGKLVVLTSGGREFQQHAKHAEGSDTTPASHTQKAPERRAYKPQFRQKRKKITQPSGAATPRDSDAHERIAVPKALCVLRERTPGQGPKAAKLAVLTPGRAGFPNRAKRSEGRDSAPIQHTPVSPCEHLCAIFLRRPSVYPLSGVKANVGRL